MTRFSSLRLVATLVAASVFAGGALGAAATDAGTDEKAVEAPAWDQVANIRGAAERLGRLHRARGANP